MRRVRQGGETVKYVRCCVRSLFWTCPAPFEASRGILYFTDSTAVGASELTQAPDAASSADQKTTVDAVTHSVRPGRPLYITMYSKAN